MSRRTNGWEVAGQLIGLGIAAGAVYAVHRTIEQAVDQLLAQEPDEAIETLAATVPTMDDEPWQLFHNALEYRATSHRRAAALLYVAKQIRAMAPRVLHLLMLPAEQATRTIFGLVPRLDDASWTTFQLTLAGCARKHRGAEEHLRLAISLRTAVATTSELLTYEPPRAAALAGRHALELDDIGWDLFRFALADRANRDSTARLMLTTATYAREMLDLTHQLVQLPLGDAILALTRCVIQQNDYQRLFLGQALQQAQSDSPVPKFLTLHFASLPEATDYVASLSRHAPATALRTLTEEYLARPEPEWIWPTVRIVLLAQAQADQRFTALHDRAQYLHRQRFFIASLLSTPLDGLRQSLITSHLATEADDAIIDVITATGAPHRRTILEHVRDIIRLREAVESVLAQPADHAEAAVDLLVTELDEDRWAEWVAVLARHTSQSPAAGALLRYANDARSTWSLRQERLRSLVEQALADGIITPAEQRSIDQLRDQLGVPMSVSDQIVAEAQQAAQAAAEIRSAVDRVLADGVIAPEEQAELDAIQARLNVTNELVETIIAEARRERASKRRITTPLDPSMLPPEMVGPPSLGPEEQFRERLHAALADQVLTPEEARELEELRRALAISTESARQLYGEAQAAQQADKTS